MNKIVKIVASFTFLLLSTTIAASDHEQPNSDKLQPGLYWQQMPVVCGHIDTVNKYLEQYNFKPENQSAGRARAKPDGSPVYVVTYFINGDRSETIATIHVPGDPEVCMIFRSFDLHWFSPELEEKNEHKDESFPDFPVPKENKQENIEIPEMPSKTEGVKA